MRTVVPTPFVISLSRSRALEARQAIKVDRQARCHDAPAELEDSQDAHQAEETEEDKVGLAHVLEQGQVVGKHGQEVDDAHA